MEFNSFDNKNFHLYLNDGILHLIMKEGPITRGTALKMIECRKQLVQNKHYPLYISDIGISITNTDREFRNFIGKSDGVSNIIAAAIKSNTLLNKFLCNYFFQVSKKSKKSIPIKYFNKKNEALEWLKNEQIKFNTNSRISYVKNN